jgi:uncharacterized protein with HEPN domain
MSRDHAYLLDILNSAWTILEYMKGKEKDEFSKDSLLQDAVIRRLEIIGEASSRISAETQAQYPHLPWLAMKGTRNRVIHEYDSVEIEIIWDIIEIDLPSLITELEKIVPPREE